MKRSLAAAVVVVAAAAGLAPPAGLDIPVGGSGQTRDPR